MKYLDMRWNVLFDCDNYRISNVIKYAPSSLKKEYMESRNDPYIIHYGGGTKPWNLLPTDFAYDFWSVARETPYYELLIYNMCERKSWEIAHIHYHNCHISIFTKVKRKCKDMAKNIADIFFPKGTTRRIHLKGVLKRLKII